MESFQKHLTEALLLRWRGVEVSEVDGCLIKGLWVGVLRADREGHGLPKSIYNFGASIDNQRQCCVKGLNSMLIKRETDANKRE